MRRQSTYQPVIAKVREWPLVKLNKRREEFLEAVIKKSIKALLDSYTNKEDLHLMLSKMIRSEQMRTEIKSWRADPSDDKIFWHNIESELVNSDEAVLHNMLSKIIERYVSEISGKFYVSHYNLGAKTVTHALSRILRPVKFQNILSSTQVNNKLKDKIHISGEVDKLRKLVVAGTVVMVPTHFSHLDSAVIAWVIHNLGLPPFIYGAGLNLFNSKFFGYFMEKIGTYKVDRRKKNLVYLVTLQSYSCLALQWGCHSLFYPSGTRSRSGSVETNLKTGLLKTVADAQVNNFSQNGHNASKIFLVPITLNYPFVLEAPLLIRDHLEIADVIEKGVYEDNSHLYNILLSATNIITKGSYISITIGEAVDLFCNKVDINGNSYDSNGNFIEIHKKFNGNDSEVKFDYSKEGYTQNLSKYIVDAHFKDSCVLPSQLVAYVTFKLFSSNYPNLEFSELFKLPTLDMIIEYEDLKINFSKYRDAFLTLNVNGKIKVENCLKNDNIDELLKYGINNLGIYHAKKPILRRDDGKITTQDLATLYYYHNRLIGYDVEKYIE